MSEIKLDSSKEGQGLVGVKLGIEAVREEVVMATNNVLDAKKVKNPVLQVEKIADLTDLLANRSGALDVLRQLQTK